jgi:hypothetical protein
VEESKDKLRPRKMRPDRLRRVSSISWIGTGSSNDSLWNGPERCRSINLNFTADDLIEIKLHQRVAITPGVTWRPKSAAATRSEAAMLSTVAPRLIAEWPRLTPAPSQNTGKNCEHCDDYGGNQYRIDRHNYLLLIRPTMSKLTRRSLMSIKLPVNGQHSISTPPN